MPAKLKNDYSPYTSTRRATGEMNVTHLKEEMNVSATSQLACGTFIV